MKTEKTEYSLEDRINYYCELLAHWCNTCQEFKIDPRGMDKTEYLIFKIANLKLELSRKK